MLKTSIISKLVCFHSFRVSEFLTSFYLSELGRGIFALEVKHRSDEQLEETLKEVSSPQSSSYGHYWSLNACRLDADLRPSYVFCHGLHCWFMWF